LAFGRGPFCLSRTLSACYAYYPMTTGAVLIENVGDAYADYLRDESRRAGCAASISFPADADAMAAHVRLAAAEGRRVTVQGARTGITGGAVPDGGHVLNLSRMDAVGPVRTVGADGAGATVVVQPGVPLSSLREAVRSATAGRFFFPPDPTETSASIGGMASCNASGAQSFHYGPTRRYVQRLRVVLADGDMLELVRGRERAEGRRFRLTTLAGRVIEGRLPSYRLPSVKNAAGYFVEDDMSMLDLFIGAEGTLGILAGVELRLVPCPPVAWGVQAFLPSEDAALEVVKRLRAAPAAGRTAPVALEFFDAQALNLLRELKRDHAAFADLPALPADWHTGVYAEYHAADEAAAEQAVVELSEAMTAAGGDADATWLAGDRRDMERLKAFRHAVPEAVNLRIDERRRTEPGLTKLGTDLAVPDGALERMLQCYRRDLEAAGLAYVKFGHIGDNHLHINILPRSVDEYEQGKAMYRRWARQAVELGGTVSAEHGIGKLKTDFLRIMYGEEGIREMRALKRCFDPDGLLCPGNLFGHDEET
jgi:D-lactate dehydrogenase (cytochrome)